MLFVEFFRCTPAIVQIVWIFYCVPMLFDVFLDPITMGVLALGLNLMAFNAEAYRASIQAVPTRADRRGDRPWAESLATDSLHRPSDGFSRFRPRPSDQWYRDLPAKRARRHRRDRRTSCTRASPLRPKPTAPSRPFTVVALIYFAVSFPVTQMVGLLERRRQQLIS